MSILEIRHRIALCGNAFIVIENFGDQPPRAWRALSFADAEAFVARRKTLMLEVIADISDDAREAVADATHIYRIPKAGHA